MSYAPSRRAFIKASLACAAAASAGLATGCASHRSASSRSAGVIDTHTHFYDPSRPQGVPWPPRNDTLLYRTVLPKDYRAESVPQPLLSRATAVRDRTATAV